MEEPIMELAGKRDTRGEGKASTCSDRGPHEVRAKQSENERAPFCTRSPIPSPTRSLVGPCSRVVGRLLPFLSSLPLEKFDKWGMCISRDQLTDETLSVTHALQWKGVAAVAEFSSFLTTMKQPKYFLVMQCLSGV